MMEWPLLLLLKGQYQNRWPVTYTRVVSIKISKPINFPNSFTNIVLYLYITVLLWYFLFFSFEILDLYIHEIISALSILV